MVSSFTGCGILGEEMFFFDILLSQPGSNCKLYIPPYSPRQEKCVEARTNTGAYILWGEEQPPQKQPQPPPLEHLWPAFGIPSWICVRVIMCECACVGCRPTPTLTCQINNGDTVPTVNPIPSPDQDIS